MNRYFKTYAKMPRFGEGENGPPLEVNLRWLIIDDSLVDDGIPDDKKEVVIRVGTQPEYRGVVADALFMSETTLKEAPADTKWERFPLDFI